MYLLQYNHAFHIPLADYPTTDFWVDGSDLIFENDWMWVRTDSLFKYTDWDVANNNPSNNNGYENCMEISLRVNATWNDDNCEKMQSFICEREWVWDCYSDTIRFNVQMLRKLMIKY